MIAGFFHQGSGLGNQLFRYVTTRTLAEDKGYSWGMIHPILFKGSLFMSPDLGAPIPPISDTFTPHLFQEKRIDEYGIDVRGYDPEINFVEDNTIIDGEFQDPKYWEHRLYDIHQWLMVEPLDLSDDFCVIGFRGGEFTMFPDLFLPQEYWNTAMERMLKINPSMQFEVHTDDPPSARKFFPTLNCIHDVGLNWRSVRHAKYAIIANSSFYIFPRLLRHSAGEAITIAPRYWARRNIRTWALPSNFYRQFSYI